MAYGQAQGGGVMVSPDVSGLGVDTWAAMSGVHPDSPLVGGRGAQGIQVTGQSRRVAVSSTDPTTAVTSGAPMGAHWRELFNLRGNPMGWVLIASIIYLGLAHITLKGRVGKTRASVSSG